MIKVLFICHGNICRSPMAEYMFRDLAEKRGAADQFFSASAATSPDEIGNPVYPGARQKLASVGITDVTHTAVQLQKEDYDRYDYLIGMEESNIRGMMRITGGDPEHKIVRLLDFSDRPRDIADPWYTGNFEVTYADLTEGLEAFFRKVYNEN